MFPDYKYHIFVCQNQRPDGHPSGCCMSKLEKIQQQSGRDILDQIKAKVKELGLENVRINKSGCLGTCKNGPAMVCYPEGVWCKADEFETLLEKLK